MRGEITIAFDTQLLFASLLLDQFRPSFCPRK